MNSIRKHIHDTNFVGASARLDQVVERAADYFEDMPEEVFDGVLLCLSTNDGFRRMATDNENGTNLLASLVEIGMERVFQTIKNRPLTQDASDE